MAYVWITWLADALRAEGCSVVEESGWQSRGRPSSSGSFNPTGILWHHTGTTASASNPHPTLSMCINGRPDLSGPLCHVLIGYDGRCHVIAAGRANHAGSNQGSGPIPAGDGNAQMVGFEIDYNGTQPMSEAQYRASILAAAAVLRRLGRSADYGRQHKETSAEGKWDPGGYDAGPMRADTAAQLAGNYLPSEPTTVPEEDDMILIYGRSPYLLSGGKLVAISTADKDRAVAVGVPAWGVDNATWPNVAAVMSANLATVSGDAAAVISKNVWERYSPGGLNLAAWVGQIGADVAWLVDAIQAVAGQTGTPLSDPPDPIELGEVTGVTFPTPDPPPPEEYPE